MLNIASSIIGMHKEESIWNIIPAEIQTKVLDIAIKETIKENYSIFYAYNDLSNLMKSISLVSNNFRGALYNAKKNNKRNLTRIKSTFPFSGLPKSMKLSILKKVVDNFFVELKQNKITVNEINENILQILQNILCKYDEDIQELTIKLAQYLITKCQNHNMIVAICILDTNT
ncbi:hypothetical protein BABL1_gene_795 [Candidatus Babela massiliensis]|uniref:Uncharacterized protein n=2 Tax=Candidatus Babela massiliensis TaxID=673862 RepID=V6DHQ2_9BACT|nr:hypothetical protein BABL1_gene_795 [Candidatus Babela massiliensis]